MQEELEKDSHFEISRDPPETRNKPDLKVDALENVPVKQEPEDQIKKEPEWQDKIARVTLDEVENWVVC